MPCAVWNGCFIRGMTLARPMYECMNVAFVATCEHVLLISEWKNNPGKLLCKWAVCLVEWTLVCGMT